MLFPGSIATIAAGMDARNIDPREILRYFSWVTYCFVAALYSCLVFSAAPFKAGPRVLSKENMRSIPEVLGIHAAFLIIVLACMATAPLIVRLLPFWMTDTFDVRGHPSIFDILAFLIMSGLYLIERLLVYTSP
jgi:hypothetical protein